MTTKTYKMVALDLDGTLLRSDHTISDATVAYLRELHQRGFLICIATGRSAASTAQVITDLNLHFPTTQSEGFPVVCSNGAKGIRVLKREKEEDDEAKKGQISTTAVNAMIDGRLQVTQVFHFPVPMELTLKTLALAKELGCVTNYYIDHEIYAQPLCDSHYKCAQRYSDVVGVKHTYCSDDYKEAMSRGLSSKLLILCGESELDDVYEKISTQLDGEAKVIRGSPPFFVEVLRNDVCKGNGLEKMCDIMGVALDDCITFGDGDNDIEFIEKSGYGFAMINARGTLKAVADEVTEYDNNEDGVIRSLQKLEENGKLHFSCP
mmetsp:Transcript_15876/g.18784  ORF Transcript_15876/g.18784 Transcript_15876/m.18784 type:complete len:321 (-) Transcript_15876:43-1005(-)